MTSSVIGALRVNLGIDTAAFSDGLKSAQSGLSKFGATMKQGAMVAGAAFIAMGAGVAAAVKGVLNNADDMGKAAQKIGIPVDELSKLKYAADLSGVSMETLSGGIKRLSTNMAGALANPTSAAGKLFSDLGISVADANGKMRPTSEILTDIAGVLSTMPDGAEKTALAVKLLGKSGAELIPLFNGGKEALRGMMDEAAKLGIVITPEMAKNAEIFNDNLSRLSAVVGGLATMVAASLAPTLASLSDFLVQIATSFSELSPWLQDGIVRFGALSAIIAVIGAPLALVAAGIAAIGIPVAAAAAGIIALTAAVVAFWPQIAALGTAITTFVSGAWASFVSAWDGMVAKVAAVKASIAEFAASIPGIFTNLASQMVEIGGQIIQGLWDGLKAKFSSVKEWLVGSMTGMVDSVKSALGIKSPSRVMAEVGTNIMQGLSDGMTEKEGQVESIAERIAGTISSAFQGVIEGTKTVKEAISEILKSLANMLLDNAFKMLFSGMGGGGGGLGGILKGLFGGLFGFARGGTIMPGGAGGIDSQLVAFRKSPNERVDISKPGQTVSNGEGQHVTVGVSVDDDGKIQAYVKSMGKQAANAGASMAVKQVRGAMPAMLADTQARTL